MPRRRPTLIWRLSDKAEPSPLVCFAPSRARQMPSAKPRRLQPWRVGSWSQRLPRYRTESTADSGSASGRPSMQPEWSSLCSCGRTLQRSAAAEQVEARETLMQLGSELCSLSHVATRWEKAHARSYTLLGSVDGTAWTTLASAVGQEGWVVTKLPAGSKMRWVRMFGLQRATSFGFSIWEFHVYGRPGTT
mmetsp:Transcript_3398/g.6817  ORF Transcript_3398/g.6817 Transcript_3398/m.6817 type:complete len:191 (+) Transcript_3398:682-1254(+)